MFEQLLTRQKLSTIKTTKENHKILSQSKRSSSNNLIISLGIIMIVFFMYLISINFTIRNQYDRELKNFCYIFLSAIILYLIYYTLNHKRIIVCSTYFEIITLLTSKKYYYSKIKTSYSEYNKGKYNSWTTYYFILDKGKKISLIDEEYSNFHVFYTQILQRIKVDSSLNEKILKTNFLKYSIISGVISCLIFLCTLFIYPIKKQENNNYIYLKSVVLKDMQLITESKRRNHFEFSVAIKPQLIFKISGSQHDAIGNKDAFVKTFQKNKPVYIGITQDDYDKRIKKIKELSTIEKYFHYYTVNVYQLKDDTNNYYIDLDVVNKSSQESTYAVLGFIIFFGLFFLYLTYGNLNAYLKSLDEIKKPNN